MSLRQFSRREFLVIGGSAAAAIVVGVPSHASRAIAGAAPNHLIFKLSVRGRRGSNAAKLHNANKLFATAAAADLHRAHPGDHSRIVQIVVNDATFQRLFPTPETLVADLRKVVLGCIGDCDQSGEVSEPEILTMVDNALGKTQLPICHKGDLNRDATITVDEILNAVNNAQRSCDPTS